MDHGKIGELVKIFESRYSTDTLKEIATSIGLVGSEDYRESELKIEITKFIIIDTIKVLSKCSVDKKTQYIRDVYNKLSKINSYKILVKISYEIGMNVGYVYQYDHKLIDEIFGDDESMSDIIDRITQYVYNRNICIEDKSKTYRGDYNKHIGPTNFIQPIGRYVLALEEEYEGFLT